MFFTFSSNTFRYSNENFHYQTFNKYNILLYIYLQISFSHLINFCLTSIEIYYYEQIYLLSLVYFFMMIEGKNILLYMLELFSSKFINFISFVGLPVPLNLPFCMKKISNNELFLFQISILASTLTSMDVKEGGLHAHTIYNPDAWGSTTTEKGTRVSRRLAEDQVMGNLVIEPPPRPTRLTDCRCSIWLSSCGTG